MVVSENPRRLHARGVRGGGGVFKHSTVKIAGEAIGDQDVFRRRLTRNARFAMSAKRRELDLGALGEIHQRLAKGHAMKRHDEVDHVATRRTGEAVVEAAAAAVARLVCHHRK